MLEEKRAAFAMLIPNPRMVNIEGARAGARRLAFVLESCRVGSVPDAPLLAALLHLVRYSMH
jgi:hypothetical protein